MPAAAGDGRGADRAIARRAKDWAQATAELLAQDFGEKKDRQLWGQFQKIAELVRVGKLEADAVLNAYRQGMAPAIRKPGAKFWAAWQGLTGMDEGDLKDLAAGKEGRHASR